LFACCANFEVHPNAEIYLSLPGLGPTLGARVLAEFGDDRTRFDHPKARKNYAGKSPVTKQSGTRREEDVAWPSLEAAA
jgi:transposase